MLILTSVVRPEPLQQRLPGNTAYSLSVSFGTDGSQYFGAWIDYNHNGIYEASEVLGLSGNAGASGTIAVSFTVPTSAYNGLTHMRIVGGNDAAVLASQACGASSSSFGETQDYDVTITGGSSVAPYGGAISGYSWSNGTNTVGTTNPLVVNPTSATTYSVTVTSSGCTVTSNSVSVATLTLPTAPGGTNSSQCGTHHPGVFVTSGGGNNTYNWYLQAIGGTAIAGETAASLSAGYSISATTHFWVSENGGTCESARTEVVATVGPADPVQAVTNNSTPCANTAIQLTASNTATTPVNIYTYSWNASPLAGSGLSGATTANPISVTPTTAGTYTYTVTANDATAGCTTIASVSVTVKALPVIDSVRASQSPICAGTTVTLNGYSAGLSSGPTGLPATYCVPDASGGAGSNPITSVTFNTLSNTGIVQASPYYDIYPATGTNTTTVFAGQTYALTVAAATSILSVWIDYNRNGVFEPTEWQQVWTSASSGTINILIPANAVAGQTAMRLRSRGAGNTNGSADACSTFFSGTGQDYTLNIIGVVKQNPALNYTWAPGGMTGFTATATSGNYYYLYNYCY